MGTRHLICVAIDGEYKVAQYGQWDGYPSGQGLTVLYFLANLDADGLEQFKAKVRAATWISDEDLKALWAGFGADGSGFVSLDIAARMERAHPEHSRNTGAGILQIVMDAPAGIRLHNSIDFAADSLMCEWAYVVDLDKGTLEVYKGFNHEPLDSWERFAGLPKRDYSADLNSDYFQVRRIATFVLADLPTKAEFLAATGDSDSEAA